MYASSAPHRTAQSQDNATAQSRDEAQIRQMMAEQETAMRARDAQVGVRPKSQKLGRTAAELR